MKRTAILLMTAMLCGLSPFAFSQSYPSKPVIIIVPYPSLASSNFNQIDSGIRRAENIV